MVFGYGDVGKGCAQALKGQGCRVIVTEIDPICALQAAMEGYQVTTLEDVIETADIFITATGNKNIITVDHMARMKDKAIIGNIGHFDNEIDMAGLAKSGAKRVNIKPQYDEWVFPRRRSRRAQRAGAGRRPAAEPRLRHRPPELRDELVVHQPGGRPARPALQRHRQADAVGHELRRQGVYMLPKKLDEMVARLHLDKLGVKLTRLTKEQADYIGVPVTGRSRRRTTATSG